MIKNWVDLKISEPFFLVLKFVITFFTFEIFLILFISIFYVKDYENEIIKERLNENKISIKKLSKN